MIQHIKIGEMKFPEVQIKPSQLHKVRGYFARQFNQFDLIHNHDRESGKYIYRYPAIQFKIHDYLAVHAYKEEGLDVLKEIFLGADAIDIEGRVIEIGNKEVEVKDVPFGEDGGIYEYQFFTPWLGLNQENYKAYMALEKEEHRQAKLHSILINNIISFCKFAEYTLEEKLVIRSKFVPKQTILKGKAHLSFVGEFEVNFLLPDLLGLGKSPSRGYGNVLRKIKE